MASWETDRDGLLFLLQEIDAVRRNQERMEEEVDERLDDLEFERHDMVIKSLTSLQKEVSTIKSSAKEERGVSFMDEHSDNETDDDSVRERARALVGRVSNLSNGDIEEESPDEDDENLLPEDIYSFFATTNYFHQGRPRTAFALAAAVFVTQILTLALFAIDVIDLGNRFNPLGIPPGVENTVRFSQVIALLITAVSQDETQLSLNILAQGYDTQALDRFTGTVTPLKWYTSLLTRFLIGALSYAVTFMLIIRSDTVRDLMLDFTAVSFVSQIDDGTFTLGKWGYLGRAVRKEAEEILTIPVLMTVKDKFSLTREASRSRVISSMQRRKIPRFLSLILMLMGLIITWFVLTVRQINGKYVSKVVFVQFDDDFSIALGTFSGLYEMKVGNQARGGRDMQYVAVRNVPAALYQARFSYCVAERAWIFQIGQDPGTLEDLSSFNCENSFIAKSASTATFDLAETAEGSWFYRDRVSKQNLPLKHYVIQGQDGYFGKDCTINSECGTTGLMFCDKDTGDGTCACLNGRYGVNCEFTKPCEQIEIDEQADPEGFVDTRPWSFNWNSVLKDNGHPYSVYNKPIYIGENVRDGKYDVMMFAGRRWVISNTGLMPDIVDGDLSPVDVASFLEQDFHAYWSAYPFAFRTFEVDFGTPTATATPVDKGWVRIESANGLGLTTRDSSALLLCATCDETNPCFFNATCQADSTCFCATGSTGTLCQIPPVGDGVCHTFFNNVDYEFDGGDCCQTTCVSSSEVVCGETATTSWTGLQVLEFTGYDFCADINELCNPTDSDCWNPVYTRTSDVAFSKQGKTVAVSGDSAVWAVVDDFSITVLEQYGSSYRQRGDPFLSEDPVSVAFSADGSSVAMAATEGGVFSFIWEARGRKWKEMGLIDTAEQISSIALSSEGTVLAIGYKTEVDSSKGGHVDVYAYNFGSLSWEIQGSQITDNVIGAERHVSLSDGGQTVAVGLYTANPAFVNPNGNTTDTGVPDYVAIYDFDGSDWSQRGQKLEVVAVDESTYERFGRWISLSGAGDRIVAMSTLVVGEDKYRRVRAYQFDNVMNAWTQLGGILSENLHDSFDSGPAASLSSDGKMIAVAALNSEELVGFIELFRYDETTSNWTALRDTVVLGLTALNIVPSVSLSSDGRFMSVGQEDRFGSVILYHNSRTEVFERETLSPDKSLTPLSFSITLDRLPEETGLLLECEGSEPFGKLIPGDFIETDASVEAEIYVETGTRCEFVITDSKGDGICCSQGDGKYEIFYGDRTEENLIARGGSLTFGSYEKLTFTAADPSDRIPVTLELSYSNMVDFAREVAIYLNCEDAVESAASKSAFSDALGSEIDLTGTIAKTFFLPNATACRVEITKKSAVGDGDGKLCETCTLAYEIFQGNENDAPADRTVLAKQEPSAWIMSPTDIVAFTVLKDQSSSVPLTVVIKPDLKFQETGYLLSCGTSLSVGFDTGFLASGGAVLSSDIMYMETYYVPLGSKCVLTVMDESNDGMCCDYGNGYFQLYFGDMDSLSDENLVYQGDIFDSSETVNFEARPPSSDASILRIVFQVDSHPEETGFQLQCDGQLDLTIDLADHDIVANDRAAFIFSLTDVASCTLVVTDSAGNGIDGGYYEVLNGDEPLLYVNDFDSSSSTHDLSEPPLVVSLTAVVQLDTLDNSLRYELRCASAVSTGSIMSESLNQAVTLSFDVLDGLVCQFSLLDAAGDGLCCSQENQTGYYQLYYGDMVDPDKLLVEGGSFHDREIIIFTVVPPAPTNVRLGVEYALSLGQSFDRTYTLKCPDMGDMVVADRQLELQMGQILSQVFVIPNSTGCVLQYTDCCDDLVRASYDSLTFHIFGTGNNTSPSSGEFMLPGLSNETFVPVTLFVDGLDFTVTLFESPWLVFDSVLFLNNTILRDQFEFVKTSTLVGSFMVEKDDFVTVSAFDMVGVQVSAFSGRNTLAQEDLIFSFQNESHALFTFDANPEDFEEAVDIIVGIDFDQYPLECTLWLDCDNGFTSVVYFTEISKLSETRLAFEHFQASFARVAGGTTCTLDILDQFSDGLQGEGFKVSVGDNTEELYGESYSEVRYEVVTGPPPTLSFVYIAE